MSQSVTYVLSLTDRMSGPMSKITGSSAQTIGMLDKLQQQSKTLKAATGDLGGSLSTLRAKVQLLRGEKEMINPKNLADIKRYNQEIKGLEKQIDKLDNAGNGGGLSRYFSELKGSIGVLVNPLTIAATAIGFAAKEGMNMDEQFAKVNITAQLEGDDFEKLKTDIVGVAKKNKVDISMAPGAYEKILSQTGDVNMSLQILDSTLKGSKAGFTDASVVADALAQTLSSVGKDAANADEILDTLFAAKRVGAGEFKDFANYIPGLVASGKSLQIGYKEVAGVYAYMTGKGNSAEKSAVYMKNMFSMLGRTEVTGKLKKAGVNVFDNGKIRSTVDIFTDLNRVMSTMSGQQQSAFMENIGVVDQEAKAAFSLMASDTEKLKSSLTDCANASGEADRALALSANSAQRAAEVWAAFKGKLNEFGTAILPVVNTGIIVLGGALDVVSAILTPVVSMFGGWYDKLADGNPIIWGLTSALTAAGVLLLGHQIKLKAVSLWNTISAATCGAFTRAMAAANASMLASPWGWVALGVGLVVAGVMALTGKTDKLTKSFAAMNVEMSKVKKETDDNFSAAMNATAGSEARATAIEKINTQYGFYLPHLLTEKSSNDEIAAALRTVNSELERKILNKFRDQAMEDSLKQAEDVKTSVLNDLLDKVPERQQQQLAADFQNEWELMQDGKTNGAASANRLSKKYGITNNIFDNLYDELENLELAAQGHAKREKRINMMYSQQQPASTASTASAVNVVVQPPIFTPTFSPVFNPVINNLLPTATPTQANPNTGTPVTTTGTVAGSTQTAAGNNALIAGLGGKRSGSAASNVFDLDQTVVNKKGSTAYNAVISKLGRVKMAGLAAASMAGVAATSPAMTVPPISSASSTVKAGDKTDYNDPARQKTLNLDKFCDQIVIHIAKADDQGMDTIREKVINVLKQVVDGQQA